MKQIALMDTSVMSFNIGDQIIMESIHNELSSILKDSFIVNMPTHSPLFHFWEFSLRGKDSLRINLNNLDLKFVCGTNLLEKNMKKRKNLWNIHMLDSNYIKDFILVGVGSGPLDTSLNNYTRRLYKRILSSQYTHSTRDENTKILLEKLGLKAINTGCPTLWQLTKKHCSMIPTQKSDTVVFTLTDYMENIKKDEIFINILKKNYNNLYYWVQGSKDLDYLQKLNINISEINIISPSLKSYNYFLENNICDYVGTRLHAGIKAMQKKKRAIIIGVDNRARDMHITCNLNYIERNRIDFLDNMINSEFETKININFPNIELFLKQFI